MILERYTMAIAKKPIKYTSENHPQQEKVIEAFISGSSNSPEKKPRENKKPIMIRFDPVLLNKVDQAAHRRGISRSAWIQYVISRAIDQGEG